MIPSLCISLFSRNSGRKTAHTFPGIALGLRVLRLEAYAPAAALAGLVLADQLHPDLVERLKTGAPLERCQSSARMVVAVMSRAFMPARAMHCRIF